jgi:hypothetical protein
VRQWGSPYGFDTLRGMADVPPEVRKEFEKWLDDYIEQYRKAIDRLLRRQGRVTRQSAAAADFPTPAWGRKLIRNLGCLPALGGGRPGAFSAPRQNAPTAFPGASHALPSVALGSRLFG